MNNPQVASGVLVQTGSVTKRFSATPTEQRLANSFEESCKEPTEYHESPFSFPDLLKSWRDQVVKNRQAVASHGPSMGR